MSNVVDSICQTCPQGLKIDVDVISEGDDTYTYLLTPEDEFGRIDAASNDCGIGIIKTARVFAGDFITKCPMLNCGGKYSLCCIKEIIQGKTPEEIAGEYGNGISVAPFDRGIPFDIKSIKAGNIQTL